jgi:glycosyltransferase involved in cell wall biosynthesis
LDAKVETVAMVVGSYPPMPCGVGDYAAVLCRHLATQGLKIHVITSRGAADGPAPPTGVTVHADQPGWSIWRLGKLTRKLKEINPDVVHVQYPSSGFGKGLGPAFLPSRLDAASFYPPVVATIHEYRISHYLRRMASRALAHDSEGLIFPCQFEKDIFFKLNRSIERMEKPARVIPVGPSLPPSPKMSDEMRAQRRDARRREWGIYDNRPIFFHFGLPSPSKGIDDLLLALGKLSREDFDHHLVIAGRFEPETDSFHRFIRSVTMKLGLMSSTTFLGMVPPEEVGDIMNACDVGLFPFRDGVSLRRTSWIAALIEDLPTITTEPVEELPGLAESSIVRLVPRRNISALATAILEIGSNPKILENMRAGDNRLKARFSWPDIASRTIDFYQLAARRKFDRVGERMKKKRQAEAERPELPG